MTALTVHNAEIHTATVEVKTLTISGRQVTQAVFKQLPNRQIINDDGRLNGQPWGWVNYHPDKCGSDDRHLHVVWQDGKELFRARIDFDVTYPRWFQAETATTWLDAKVRDNVTGPPTGWKPMKVDFTHTLLGITINMVMSDIARRVTSLREQLEQARHDLARYGPAHLVTSPTSTPFLRVGMSGKAAALAAADAARHRIAVGAAVGAVEEELGKAVAHLPAIPLAEAEALLTTEVRAEVERRERHRAVRADLADLPQLFIAAG